MLPLIFSYSEELTNSDYNGLSFLLVRLITFLILFFILIGAAYFTSRYISSKSRSFMNQKNLKVIEKISLGIEKSIYLISLDKQYYIISTTKNNIQLIDKIDGSCINIEEFSPNKMPVNSLFNDYLDKYLNKKNNEEPISKIKGLNTNLVKKLTDIRKLNDELKEVKEEVGKDEK